MKFRVRVGKHTDENGKVHNSSDPETSIVDTKIDLVQRFGPKFERVYVDPTVPKNDDGLDAFTLKKLQEIAHDEEIDLKGASRKEDIIAVIRAFRSDLVEA